MLKSLSVNHLKLVLLIDLDYSEEKNNSPFNNFSFWYFFFPQNMRQGDIPGLSWPPFRPASEAILEIEYGI
jgi:hypothetical protein